MTAVSPTNNTDNKELQREDHDGEDDNEEQEQELSIYEHGLRKLYFIDNVKRGLQNMEELNDALGKPLDQSNIGVIHVAGTNGKGSVALKVAKSLEHAGYKVGLLISPHIASYRERISINGTLISEEDVNEHLKLVLRLCDTHNILATFFEITTALSFSYFVSCSVDFVVLETGLGGRLDATNVITKPKLCIITSIGLEHTAILGDTVELIAVEKAGIIKKDVPVLVGPNVPHDVIRQCAKDNGAEGYYTCEDVFISNYKDEEDSDGYGCGGNEMVLNGIKYIDYDIENSRVASCALELLKRDNDELNKKITKEDIQRGTSIRPSCRFEVIEKQIEDQQQKVKVILDIAHNPPAMKTLIAKLQATYPDQGKRIVVGFSADKDVLQCSQALLSIVKDPSRIHLVEAVNLRAAKIQTIICADPQMKGTNFDVEDRSITAQVRLALTLAEKHNEILVVCGSVFLMAEAREALGIDEPRDTQNITSVAGKGLLKCKQRLMSLNTAKSKN